MWSSRGGAVLTCTRWPVRPQNQLPEGQRSVEPDDLTIDCPTQLICSSLSTDICQGNLSDDLVMTQQVNRKTWATSGKRRKTNIAQAAFLACWGKIKSGSGSRLIYPLLVRLHWLLFHSPMRRKHVQSRDSTCLQSVHGTTLRNLSGHIIIRKATFQRLKKHNFGDWVQDGIICSGFGRGLIKSETLVRFASIENISKVRNCHAACHYKIDLSFYSRWSLLSGFWLAMSLINML